MIEHPDQQGKVSQHQQCQETDADFGCRSVFLRSIRHSAPPRIVISEGATTSQSPAATGVVTMAWERSTETEEPAM